MRFRAQVEKGEGRGEKIGFPTLNFRCEELAADFAGVFVAKLWLADRAYGAAAHIGHRPTFDDFQQVIELHLLDFDDFSTRRKLDYGDMAEIEILERIRGVKKFSGVEELTYQLKNDVEAARRILYS